MRRTIAGLLTLARADAGTLAAAFRRIDLVDLLEELTARWCELAAVRRVSIESRLPEHGVIVCDPDLIVRVVDNLVDNAVRVSPVGGTVTLSAQRQENTWVLAVRNAGPSLTAEVAAALRSRAESRPDGRAGLGLALCAAIVRVHGGSITAMSDSSETSFVVRLPAGENSTASS